MVSDAQQLQRDLDAYFFAKMSFNEPLDLKDFCKGFGYMLHDPVVGACFMNHQIGLGMMQHDGKLDYLPGTPFGPAAEPPKEAE